MDVKIVLAALRRKSTTQVLMESCNACGFELIPPSRMTDTKYRSKRFIGVYTPCISYSRLCDDIDFQEQINGGVSSAVRTLS